MRRRSANQRGFTLLEIMIVVFIIGVLAALGIPNFVRARVETQKNLCLSNLRIIEGAKEQYALINHKPQGGAVDENEVDRFVKNGPPQCPAGGEYTYGVVGTTPQCSLAEEQGHVLSAAYWQEDEQGESGEEEDGGGGGRGKGGGKGKGKGKGRGQGQGQGQGRRGQG